MAIDTAIFSGFLLANFLFGLWASRSVKNIKEYAIGNRDFSTATITATIVATWVSGESFFSYLSDSYSQGLYAISAYIFGEVSYFFLLGYFLAPRLGEFLGKLSIAEAMGDLYGKNVRIITSAIGCISIIGLIAMQLQVAGLLFEYCFNIQSFYGVLIAGMLITIYSTLGGIKSVTFTDVIQFVTFSTIIPIIIYFIFVNTDTTDLFINTINQNPIFDYHKVFDFTQPKSLYYLSIAFIVTASGFGPPMFLRISMARNINQVSKSFVTAGFTCLFLAILMSWIGILVLSSNPNLNPSEVVKYVLFNYSSVGLKGLALAGIMAMVMSTIDSYINSAAVLFVHDFCKPLGFKFVKDELFFSRLSSLLIGLLAILIVFNSNGSLMQLLITSNLYYIPLITVPFIFTTLGFRSSGKSVVYGMIASFITVTCFNLFSINQYIIPIIPGVIANIVFLFGSHYFLKQPGGWIGIKNKAQLEGIKYKRKVKIYNFIKSIRNFNLINYFNRYSLANEAAYVSFGIFCIISTLSTMHTLPKNIQLSYPYIINFIYTSVLTLATLLISYPLWLPRWKNKTIISITWNLSVFYILICVGFFLVIISNFAHMQLMTFMVNIIVIAVLIRWQLALFMIIGGLLITTKFFKYFIGITTFTNSFAATEFKVTYLLLILSSILVVFLKPKQDEQELSEELNRDLNDKIAEQYNELNKLTDLKNEFIRNLQHETNTPLTGIASMGQTLRENYDNFPEQQRREIIDVIGISSERLISYVHNLVDLSKLSTRTYELNLKKIDISNLVVNIIEQCKRLYIPKESEDDRDFILNIEPNIIINCDEYYLGKAFKNIIVNAIQYCKKGKIEITLKTQENRVSFIINDEGVGIPPLELNSIFESFTTSTLTKSKAGGRGVGLAVAHAAIKLHKGEIKAESDGKSGSTFIVTLPIN